MINQEVNKKAHFYKSLLLTIALFVFFFFALEQSGPIFNHIDYLEHDHYENNILEN